MVKMHSGYFEPFNLNYDTRAKSKHKSESEIKNGSEIVNLKLKMVAKWKLKLKMVANPPFFSYLHFES